jgi:hypothetical protein
MTETSPVDGGEVQTFRDVLRTRYRVRNGRFSIHANPSTRPIVQGGGGRKATGPPSDPVQFSGGPGTTTPCADFDTEDPACFNDHPFRVPASNEFDNDSAVVRVEWATPASDWDVKVFKDSNGDGSSEGEGDPIGASGSAPTSSEQASVADLERGGDYVVRMINYAAVEPYNGTITFAGPPPPKRNKTEKWTLNCLSKNGKKVGAVRIAIKRGRTKSVDLRRACR